MLADATRLSRMAPVSPFSRVRRRASAMVPAGPITVAPASCRIAASSSAIRNSSSTTRILAPSSRGGVQSGLLGAPMIGGPWQRQRNLARQSIGPELTLHLGAGNAAFDEQAAE